ncbi:hypothetical protein BDF19DRAFT_102540 [Syncephalis fuscata]|nr:hypothetical protein BDF19DRAFT_102540 [Syncephalis fuscata]
MSADDNNDDDSKLKFLEAEQLRSAFYRLLRWEDPMYTLVVLGASLATVSLTVNQSPLVVLLAVSTLALAMGLAGFRLWALLTQILWLRETAYRRRQETVAKYKERVADAMAKLIRVWATWWLDLVLVKDEQESFKALIACFVFWMLCIFYPTWVTLNAAVICLFTFPKIGRKARTIGIYLLEQTHQEG